MAPYLQTFIITMETGTILQVTVTGEDRSHGEGLAISAAKDLIDGQVYDLCDAPQAASEGTLIINQYAPRKV
jgi:hypothetical protein